MTELLPYLIFLIPFLLYRMVMMRYSDTCKDHLVKALRSEALFPGLLEKNLLGLLIFAAGSLVFILSPFAVPLFTFHLNHQVVFALFCLFLLAAGALAREGFKKRSVLLGGQDTAVPFTPIIYYILLRVLYLFWYEVYFRGTLLLGLVEIVPLSTAIGINVLLYFLIHIPDGKKQALLSIPFGLILCVFCLLFNNVWPAIVLHMTLSFCYEIPLIRFHLKQIRKS